MYVNQLLDSYFFQTLSLIVRVSDFLREVRILINPGYDWRVVNRFQVKCSSQRCELWLRFLFIYSTVVFCSVSSSWSWGDCFLMSFTVGKLKERGDRRTLHVSLFIGGLVAGGYYTIVWYSCSWKLLQLVTLERIVEWLKKILFQVKCAELSPGNSQN